MRMFFSVSNLHYLKLLLACNVQNILISHAYKDALIEGCYLLKENNAKVFLDSGAFTAWNKGGEVDMDAYMAFMDKYDDIIEVAANVDVIPGVQGRTPTQKDVKVAAEKGFENFLYLRDKGYNKVIHIFHQGEDFQHLHEMAKISDWVGISPNNDKHTSVKKQWLDSIFRFLNEHHPEMKTHAFGVTSETLMRRFPWYSVDSSTFIHHSIFGGCQTPYGMVMFSDRQTQDPKHFKQLPKEKQEAVVQWLDSICTKPSKLKGTVYNRLIVNIIFFKQLVAKINKDECQRLYNLQPHLFPQVKDL